MLNKLIRNYKIAREINNPKLSKIEKAFLTYLYNHESATYKELLDYLSAYKKTLTELDIKQTKSAICTKTYYQVIDSIDGGYRLIKPKSPIDRNGFIGMAIIFIVMGLVCILIYTGTLGSKAYEIGYSKRISDVEYCKKTGKLHLCE